MPLVTFSSSVGLGSFSAHLEPVAPVEKRTSSGNRGRKSSMLRFFSVPDILRLYTFHANVLAAARRLEIKQRHIAATIDRTANPQRFSAQPPCDNGWTSNRTCSK
jgi:hypothetical protein